MAPIADIYLEAISRNDKKINFHLALLSQICDYEFSTFETHHKDVLMNKFYINGNLVVSKPTNRGIALSLMPGIYKLKIEVEIDYDMDLSMINDYISGFSKTPEKRFQKKIVKELTVTINDTRDCYVGFTAYLHVQWDKQLDINFGDYYNRELNLSMNWMIEYTKDDYHFIRTSKEGLDKACCYWYRAEDIYEYGHVVSSAVNFYKANHNIKPTIQQSSSNYDKEYDFVDIAKELAIPYKDKAIIKERNNNNQKATTNISNSNSSQKIIHNIGTVNSKDYEEMLELRNNSMRRFKRLKMDKSTGFDELLIIFGGLNKTYYYLEDKLIDKMSKEMFFKLKVEYKNYEDLKYVRYKNKGTMFKINGEVYEGEFPGKGRYIYPNGEIYECELKDGQYNMLKKISG